MIEATGFKKIISVQILDREWVQDNGPGKSIYDDCMTAACYSTRAG